MHSPRSILWLWVAVVVVACSKPDGSSSEGVTPDKHGWFPIAEGGNHELGRELSAGQGTLSCESCHPASADSFQDFTCTGCHEHHASFTNRLHLTTAGYAYGPKTCYACHPDGSKVAFDHGGIVGECAQCHDVGAPFAALPVAGFTHPTVSGDCGGCHVTSSWKGASVAPTNAFDPAQSLSLTGQVPGWAATSIVKLTALPQELEMVMNHSSPQVPAATLGSCPLCHELAAQGAYFPGRFHSSLELLALPQPTGCASCHAAAQPAGFVGPVAANPARTPSSPEMRHEAVAWSGGAPTTTALVTQDCATCHLPPTTAEPANWATGFDGGTARYHPSLQAKGAAQPTSCLDCHANSRPTALLSAANSSLAAGLVLDHQDPTALGDCASCHSRGGATQWTSWAKGAYHLAGGAAPSTCLPCHEGERPTSTATWQSTTYTRSPFDYVGTQGDGGIPHGNGEDCVTCHPGPGTGSWGSTQNWQGGSYTHGPSASSAGVCLPCHRSQRPDLLPGETAAHMATVLGFDHSINGTGDCFGCHQATVAAGRYVDLMNPGTGQLPGGDWKDGQGYPGDTLIATPGQFVSVTAITLLRNSSQWVTGMSSATVTLSNAMKHTSSTLPTEVNAGPAGNPDYAKCWHCHTHTNGTVTAYADGFFHDALANYAATPGGAVTPLAQPTTCLDCHAQMRPLHIVEKAGSSLLPMDHAATFTAPANIGGSVVTSVAQLECAVCHHQSGGVWSDGKFHSNIGAATPADCVACHYPLMADAAKADVGSSPATRYVMKHRSAQVRSQACQSCHALALSVSSTAGSAATLWQPGTLHASVGTQPAGCVDCHAVTLPTARTQSTTVYALSQGATASNGGQWMSHASQAVAGKDCVLCHAGDAKASGSAWSKSITFHGSSPGVTTCNECHGGGMPGSNNNMPAGLVDSATVTTSSAAPSGTHAQITHDEINVSRFQCRFCHTQVGPSAAGHEWAQAKFHQNFSAGTPLMMNGTTGRCSNCHLNVKPGTSYTAQDHSAFTGSSAQDCSACHAWPGSNPANPDWKGATGAHAGSGATATSTLDCNTCHGQTGSSSTRLSVPAASHYGGVSNGNRCVSCHVNFAGFKGTTANLLYAHTNGTANAGGCVTCHPFVSQQYTTLTSTPSLTHPISAGSRSFSQTRSVTGTFDGHSFTDAHTATKMTRCGACHQYATTTSSTNIWTFKHRPSNPGISNSTGTSGCNQCH